MRSAPIKRILVANRGEIAVRVIRTCRELGIATVLAVSEADRNSLGARLADDVVCIGAAPSAASYLRGEALLTAAQWKQVDAIHPGYGFLSENAAFARMCRDQGIRFIGPSPEIITLFGDKVQAKAAARAAGVPLVEASGILACADEAAEIAEGLGFPIVLKAVKGGGGRGMRVVHSAEEVRAAFGPASAEAAAAFDDGALYLERFLARARHVEVQIAGDGTGRAMHFGDRDCSIQRKHQKLVEEAPAPGLPAELQQEVRDAAVRLASHVGYDSIGTVEFIVDAQRGDVSFLEVNARLQVEHGVTEQVTGVDLVRIQIGLAEGDPSALPAEPVEIDGHAIECRLNAEDVDAGFRPTPGVLREWRAPTGPSIRVDTHCFEGYAVPPYYDSLLAKVLCHSETREGAIDLTRASLARFAIGGVPTTRELLDAVLGSDDFRATRVWTTWLEEAMAGNDLERAGHGDGRQATGATVG